MDLEQNVDSPVPSARLRRRGDLPVSPLNTVPKRFWKPRRTIFKGFFRTFPWSKKSPRVAAQVSAELGAHPSSSTLSTHQMALLDASATCVDGNGDAWTLENTAHLVLAEPGLDAHTVAPAKR